MRRMLALFTLPLLIGLPCVVSPSFAVSVLVLVSGTCLLIGVGRASPPSAATGAVFALIALTLALWEAESPNVYLIVLFGVALLSVVELVHRAHRLAGAKVERAAWHPYVQWWLGRTAFAVGMALALSVVSGVSPLLPGPGRFALGVIGVLVTFAAVTSVIWRRRPTRE